MRHGIKALGILVLFVGFGVTAETKYHLTGDNTKIEFTGTKKEGKHTGGFKKLDGTVTAEGDVAHTKIEVTIDTTSLYSDDEKLTGHLKSGDFFDVKAHPKATFVSTKVEKTDKGAAVHGKLTINDKSKEIHFPAKIETKDGELHLDAEFSIDRTDYGITYGAGKIDNNVSLKVHVSAKK